MMASPVHGILVQISDFIDFRLSVFSELFRALARRQKTVLDELDAISYFRIFSVLALVATCDWTSLVEEAGDVLFALQVKPVLQQKYFARLLRRFPSRPVAR